MLLLLRQPRHTTTNNSTNCTSRTIELRLQNAQEISRHSQLRNAHRGVDVGRVAVNKSEYCNLNHFNISYFKNPKPSSLFGFTFVQLITWTLALITSSLCFLIWIGWQWEPKLSSCTTYSVLFVIVSTPIMCCHWKLTPYGANRHHTFNIYKIL